MIEIIGQLQHNRQQAAKGFAPMNHRCCMRHHLQAPENIVRYARVRLRNVLLYISCYSSFYYYFLFAICDWFCKPKQKKTKQNLYMQKVADSEARQHARLAHHQEEALHIAQLFNGALVTFDQLDLGVGGEGIQLCECLCVCVFV